MNGGCGKDALIKFGKTVEGGVRLRGGMGMGEVERIWT